MNEITVIFLAVDEELMSSCSSAVLAKLEELKADLKKVRQEAEQQKVVAAKVEQARAAEEVAQKKGQTWDLEVEETLKGVFEARDKLQAEEQKEKEKLDKLYLAHSKL